MRQPQKPYPRAARVRTEIQHVLAEELERRRDDLGFVTITDVSLSPDLRHAKAFFTILDADDHDRIRAALTEARASLRTVIAKKVRTKFAPTLELVEDPVPDRVARIDQIIDQIHSDDDR